MLNIAGADQRQDDLFDNGNLFSRGKSALKGLKVWKPFDQLLDIIFELLTYRELRMYIPNILLISPKHWKTCYVDD